MEMVKKELEFEKDLYNLLEAYKKNILFGPKKYEIQFEEEKEKFIDKWVK